MVRRSLHLPLAAGVGTLVAGLVLTPVAAFAGPAAPAKAATATSTGPAAGAFTATRTVTRVHLVNGADQPVDSRTVTVKVDETLGLRDRQGILVSWSGARPTAGITGDPNSSDAIQQEYPVVVLQCRGMDSTKVPASVQLSPQTCWTDVPLERYGVDYSFKWSPWRVDRYAAPVDRQQWVDQPDVSGCGTAPKNGTVHYVPFIGANGTSYPIGIFGCGGIPPEAGNITSTGLPDNATWAATGLDGTGSTRFDIRTAEDNASLGCSETVACSLVVIPIMGISCDVAGTGLPAADQPAGLAAVQAATECMSNGNYAPGQVVVPNSNEAVAVSGALWWSASNWRNRIVVPLHFAPSSNVCSLDNTRTPLYFYGSELMIQATTQWAPAFCTDPKLFNFKHVQTPEPQARSLLAAGNIEAALGSGAPPGGWNRPTVSVPVAATAWVIGYQADDKDGHHVASLKLTPRLLAKLLTESYPSEPSVQGAYAALGHNPVNITVDPEFRALNPDVPPTLYYSEAASALYALSSDSDVMYGITSYINADPDARAWLDGTPDPWGMVVNPVYKGIALPTTSWPLLDTFEPLDMYRPGVNDCLAAVPVPFLPLVASPTQRMVNISLALQYGFNFAQTSCYQPNPGFSAGQKLVTAGRQKVGLRFLLGVSSYGDAMRYGFGTAELLSHTDPGAAAKFSDSTGRTFVAPSQPSLRDALGRFEPDRATGVWTLDLQSLRTAAGGAGAYPGTVVVNADIPTSGLPKADAAQYVTWLDKVTTSGQVPGVSSGTLAAGFIPLSDGPAKLAGFAQVAGPAILAQQGKVPGLLDAVPAPAPTATATPTPTAAPTGAGSGGGGPTAPPAPSSSPSARTVPSASPAPTSAGSTPSDPAGPASKVLPAVLVLAVAAGVGSALLTLRVLRAGAA